MATPAVRNQNPGNLKDPTTGSFQSFSDPVEGRAALYNDLTAKMTGTSTTGLNGNSSLLDFAKIYAPASDKNDPIQYAANLANKLGVSPDEKIGTLVPRIDDFASAVASNEDPSVQYHASSPNAPTSRTNVPSVQNQPSFLEKVGGFVGDLAKNITEPIATLIARPIQLAETIANPGISDKELADVPLLSSIYGPINAPKTGQDVLKDVGRGAQTLALGLAPSTIPGAIGMGALAGGGAGLEQSGNVGGTIGGALTGGAIGLAGGLLAKTLKVLPERMTQGAFKNLSPEQAQQMLETKSIGTKASLLNQSDKAISDLGSQLGSILKDPQFTDQTINAQGVLSKLAESPSINQYLTDTGLSFDDIASKLKSIVPSKASLIDAFFSDSGLNLEDVHRLNSALGESSFKSVFDQPEIRAGKKLGSIVYHGISDAITNVAPDTAPIFDQMSKEYGIQSILNKVVKRSPGGIIRWSDIVPFLTGMSLSGGNPLVGLGATIAERAATSPAVQFAGAKTIQGVGKGLIPVASRAGLIPLLNKKTNQ